MSSESKSRSSGSSPPGGGGSAAAETPVAAYSSEPPASEQAFTCGMCCMCLTTMLLCSSLGFAVWVLFQTTDYMVERKEKEREDALAADWVLAMKLALWVVVMLSGAATLARLLMVENERGDTSYARYVWIVLILLLPVARAVWFRAMGQWKQSFFAPKEMDKRTRMTKFIAYFAIAAAGAAASKLWTRNVANSQEGGAPRRRRRQPSHLGVTRPTPVVVASKPP